MEPMVTISVKDYNELVRNSCDKRVIEILKFIINCVKEKSAVAERYYLNFDVVKVLQSLIKDIQSEDSCFEEIVERYKNDLHHENTKENKEGSKIH